MQIDIHSHSIDKAITALKQKFSSYDEPVNINAHVFEKLFEKEYSCKIVNDDELGLRGHIIFNEEKYITAFILRFGGNDPARQYTEI